MLSRYPFPGHMARAARIPGMAALWATLFFSAHSVAQEEPANAPEHVVETVAKPSEGPTEDPRFASGFVQRLSLEGMFERGQDLAEVLRQLPGVHVRRTSGPGQPAHLSVRASSPRQLPVMLDGMRLNAPAGLGFDAGSALLPGLGQALVYLGPAAAVHGGGALAGAVDLSSARARPGFEASAVAMGGSLETLGAQGSAHIASERTGLQLHGALRQSAGDFAFLDGQGQAHTRLNNDHARWGLLSAAHLERGAHTARLTGTWEQGEAGNPGPSEFQRNFGQARIQDDRLAVVGSLSSKDLLARLGPGAWGLDTRLHAGFMAQGFRYHNPKGFVSREEVRNEAHHRHVEARVHTAIHPRSTLSLQASTEVRLDRYEAWRDAVPFLHESRAESQLQRTRQMVSVGASAEWLSFGGALSLISGLRLEWVADAKELAPMPATPSAGLVWHPWRLLAMRTNIAKTFRFPDFDELYLQTEAVRGNPRLLPERALVWDAGLDLGPPSGDWQLRLAWFENRIDQSILFVPVSAYMYEARNLEAAHAQGVEFSGQGRLHKALEARASYTWTRAGFEDAPGVPLPQQPAHEASLGAELHLGPLWPAMSTWSPTLGLSANGRGPVTLDHFGNLTSPATAWLGAGLGLKPLSWLTARLEIANLLDDRTNHDALQRPLPGRAAYLSLRAHPSALRTSSP